MSMLSTRSSLAQSGQENGAQNRRAASSFPNDFLWGTATSAYQIEGAVNEDNRGPSIWDRFAQTPGTISDRSNGDTAANHFHLYKEDIRLMKALGAKAYRFSIAWPRVFPEGTGSPNPKGLDFYNRLLDELSANGIEPFNPVSLGPAPGAAGSPRRLDVPRDLKGICGLRSPCRGAFGRPREAFLHDQRMLQARASRPWARR